MTAEQARLARPGAALARDLSALTTSVCIAVEQLRGSLRAMSDAGGASGLDVLASGRSSVPPTLSLRLLKNGKFRQFLKYDYRKRPVHALIEGNPP